MAWSPWIDLEIPKDENLSMPFDLPAPEGPRFPYGMVLSFDNHVLDKADLDIKDAAEGAEIDIRAFGKVIGYSNEDGRRCVRVQLTRIKIENEDAEETDEEKD